MEPSMRARLIDWPGVDESQVDDVDGILDLGDQWEIAGIDGHPDLRQSPWTPPTHPAFGGPPGDSDEQPDALAAMRAGDILVHYPSTRSPPASRAWFRRPPRIRTCWRSRRPCTAPRTTRR